MWDFYTSLVSPSNNLTYQLHSITLYNHRLAWIYLQRTIVVLNISYTPTWLSEILPLCTDLNLYRYFQLSKNNYLPSSFLIASCAMDSQGPYSNYHILAHQLNIPNVIHVSKKNHLGLNYVAYIPSVAKHIFSSMRSG